MNHSTTPSTSPLALHHDEKPKASWHHEVPSKLKGIEKAVEGILNPRTYTIKDSDTFHDIEAALGVNFGPNFLFWTKNLVGQTIKYIGGKIVLPSGTSFPARAANDERFSLAA